MTFLRGILDFFFFIKVDNVWKDYWGDNKKIRQVLKKQCSANSFSEIGFVCVGLQKTLKGFVFCMKKKISKKQNENTQKNMLKREQYLLPYVYDALHIHSVFIPSNVLCAFCEAKHCVLRAF